MVGGEPLVEVYTAAAEVGQGLVTVQEQIARHELGVERVIVMPADTHVGSAGSSSASRQTYMTGGAVKLACEAVRRGARAARRVAGRADRHHARAPPPADLPARREGPGRRARHVRVRRPPCGGRRRHRAGPRARGRDRHGAGRRQGDQPARRRGTDRGRHRPGPRAGADGGDPGRRRRGPQRLLHRLPDPDRARHAAGGARRARAGRPGRAVRAARGRRAADDLLDAGDRRRPARRHRGRARRACRSAPTTSWASDAGPAGRADRRVPDRRSGGGGRRRARRRRPDRPRARGRTWIDGAQRQPRGGPGHARRRGHGRARRGRPRDRRAPGEGPDL